MVEAAAVSRGRGGGSWLTEQVHDEAGDRELRTDERGGLNPQGAVHARFESGEVGADEGEVRLRGERVTTRPGRGAGRVHDSLGHRFIGADFPEGLDGGVGVEGGGVHGGVPRGTATRAAARSPGA